MGTLVEKAIQIRDEEKSGANTAPRVGGLLKDLATIIESDATGLFKKIILTKGINDYTELDYYNTLAHLGLYLLYRQQEPALVGFLKVYWTWGGTIVQELESFKMSGTASAMEHTTIMVRWKYTTGSWSEWESYQNSFIGSDKILNGNWTDEDVAPSLKEFLKETAHKKIIEWSGEVIDDDIKIEDKSVVNVTPSEIFFSSKLNMFVVYRSDKYYTSWINKDDTTGNNGQSYFTDEKGFTKNIFKTLDGSLWIATSENTIENVSSGTVSSSGPVVVRWSGIVVDDVAVLNDMTVAPGAELPSDPQNIVFIKAKRTFAYRAYDSFTQNYTYYKKFGNFELYQKNTYTEIEFIAEFTDNIFKDTNGHVWISDSAISIIKLIGDAPEDGKGYIRKDGEWTAIKNIKNGDIVLPDKSSMSLESYKESGRSDAVGVVFDAQKGLYVRKNKYSGILVNGPTASDIFYSKIGCKEPYDGKTTQKLNLLFSSNPSSDFPVFSYADTNNCYVASNGELELIMSVKDSLSYIGSNIISGSITSCTQNPQNKTSSSVFYGGSWRAQDIDSPGTTKSYALIDIL